MIVVDASALVDVLVGWGAAEAIAARLDGEFVVAPVTIDVEVLQTLRKHWLAGSLSEQRAAIATALLSSMVIERHTVEPFIERIWQLRQNVTAYDASYVVLAESLSAPLLTRDRRLAHSSAHTARIEYID